MYSLFKVKATQKPIHIMAGSYNECRNEIDTLYANDKQNKVQSCYQVINNTHLDAALNQQIGSFGVVFSGKGIPIEYQYGSN